MKIARRGPACRMPRKENGIITGSRKVRDIYRHRGSSKEHGGNATRFASKERVIIARPRRANSRHAESVRQSPSTKRYLGLPPPPPKDRNVIYDTPDRAQASSRVTELDAFIGLARSLESAAAALLTFRVRGRVTAKCEIARTRGGEAEGETEIRATRGEGRRGTAAAGGRRA